MIFQIDPRLDPEIQKYGCYFLSIAWFRERYQKIPWTVEALNQGWYDALRAGYITGDLNHDGDFDEKGQLEIANPTALCGLLGCGLRFIDGHFSSDHPVSAGQYGIYAWFNPRTKFTHFVVGNKRPVEFDPIPNSVTVREGSPKSDGLRLFEVLA